MCGYLILVIILYHITLLRSLIYFHDARRRKRFAYSNRHQILHILHILLLLTWSTAIANRRKIATYERRRACSCKISHITNTCQNRVYSNRLEQSQIIYESLINNYGPINFNLQSYRRNFQSQKARLLIGFFKLFHS